MPTAAPSAVAVPPEAMGRVVMASLVGTTIEFYDFYIYGTAAVLVIGPVFFPGGAPGVATLKSFATFALAFLARPFGSVLFGHWGDRIGRKSTLVASLLLMGVSTALIGTLPGYARIGAAAPAVLCVLRLGQGVGLGGEWGGAALLATENAPPGRAAWFGMFPQLGPPVGFLLANGLFLSLVAWLSPADFLRWGWRVPFLGSAALVVLGLYVRVRLHETPAFARALARGRLVRAPVLAVLRSHFPSVALGSLAVILPFALFYVATVYALSYMSETRGMPKPQALRLLCVAVVAMAGTTPLAGALADRWGRRAVLIGAALATMLAASLLPALFNAAAPALLGYLLLLLAIMGFAFAPVGALLPELFPAPVRYTGCSIAYNTGGLLGGSFTPLIAQALQARGGLPAVAAFLAGAAAISLAAVAAIGGRRRWGEDA